MKRWIHGAIVLAFALNHSFSLRAETGDELKEALTFHASFDGKVDADFARGDGRLYHVAAAKPERNLATGLPAETIHVVHETTKGRFGDCLHFKTHQGPLLLFRARDNLAFGQSDWEGTVSFWLRTTPDEDLAEGYTDPIQITPRSALDGCLFFEFGIEDPRPCRLGVFPDKGTWNPEAKANRDIPLYHRPLITVIDPPFSRDRWTHVAFTFQGFNNNDDEGVARLYLDGQPRGDLMSWPQQFTWDLDQAEIRLGVKFVGGLDEVSCFDRSLSPDEIATLFSLENGLTPLAKARGSAHRAADNEADAKKRRPPFKTLDLATGETATVTLVDGTTATVRLVEVRETQGKVWGEIARPEVTLEVNGERRTLVAGMYRLPSDLGGVQVDCPITGRLRDNSHIDHWALETDARIRVWPAGSPWITPDTFSYPVKQAWFASQTSFSNEPVAPRPNGQLYYHAGLDIGGAENLAEIVAATDGLVVSRSLKVMAGQETDTPISPRYDVVYLLDDRGWYYRYSHLASIDPSVVVGRRVKRGQTIGRLGKEGGSGGWSHLHFEIKSRQPSGKWGTQEGYAFLWQAFLAEQDPKIIAVARPGHVIFEGQRVRHEADRSWSRSGEITSYEWTFHDGSTATGPTVERVYPDSGTYFETLKVADASGHTDYDFVRVKVHDPDEPDRSPPRLHLAYFPTENLFPGQEITFKGRSFYHTHGEETWDFGDGSPPVKTKSDGNVDQLAKDGYVVVKHAYREPGDYLVHVRRVNEHGEPAEDRLHVRIEAR